VRLRCCMSCHCVTLWHGLEFLWLLRSTGVERLPDSHPYHSRLHTLSLHIMKALGAQQGVSKVLAALFQCSSPPTHSRLNEQRSVQNKTGQDNRPLLPSEANSGRHQIYTALMIGYSQKAYTPLNSTGQRSLTEKGVVPNAFATQFKKTGRGDHRVVTHSPLLHQRSNVGCRALGTIVLFQQEGAASPEWSIRYWAIQTQRMSPGNPRYPRPSRPTKLSVTVDWENNAHTGCACNKLPGGLHSLCQHTALAHIRPLSVEQRLGERISICRGRWRKAHTLLRPPSTPRLCLACSCSTAQGSWSQHTPCRMPQ
jgi:hypothetical protein